MPFDLVYFETYKTRSEAVAREKFLKSGAGREFIKEILKNARVVQLDTCLPAGREYQISIDNKKVLELVFCLPPKE